MHNMFEILNKAKILSNKEIRGSQVAKLSSSQLIDLSNRLSEATKISEQQLADQSFSHASSLSLSGGLEGCATFECRLSKMSELARFALLYSDRVYVYNFFIRYTHMAEKMPANHLVAEKLNFFNEVQLICYIKPLIEKGIIRLYTPPLTDYCPCCQSRLYLGKNGEKRFNRAYNQLKIDYLNNLSVEFLYDPRCRKHRLRYSGTSEFFDCPLDTAVSKEISEKLLSIKSIRDSIKAGNRCRLPKNLIKTTKLNERLVNEAMANIAFELTAAHHAQAAFVSDKEMHISFLRKISSDPELAEKNLIASKYLTTMMPFAQDVDIKSLIKLREQEADSFILYRQALNEAIGKFRDRGTLKAKDAKAIYSDIINPKLSALERRIRIAKRNLVLRPLRTAAITSLALSFGLYSGVPLAFLLGPLGLGKISSDIINQVSSLGDVENNIANDKLYFLWRVRRLTNARGAINPETRT
ncbi:MAG TPA: hypothetical protein DE315_00980 [Candidatus Omnitrophica bacterium]|nr:hypothetical protein [Candidatus Omnitrophota bacterium]